MAAESDENKRSALKAWTDALQKSAPIGRDPARTLPALIGELATRFGDAPALESRDATLSYRALAGRCNRYARWGLAQGLSSGDVVCLLMANCPEYLAIWLGLTRIGVTVALVNHHLTGELLAHSIHTVAPRHVICGASLEATLQAARAHLAPRVECWSSGAPARGATDASRAGSELPPGVPHGGSERLLGGSAGSDLQSLDAAIRTLPEDALSAGEFRAPTLAERALCIYTSGTTGLSKAANVSHYRLMQWSHWFAGMMGVTRDDRMYDCLPLYHSVGGIVATGATLVGGGTVVLRERFSAGSFWTDVQTERCTLFQYIGELCRYLLNAPQRPEERAHHLRLACGNGLRGEVWKPFQERFRVPRILEYYAATEGNFSLYNCEGRPGAIGRIPPFLAHRMPVALVRFDGDTSLPARDAHGRCVRCGVDEPGEAIGQIDAPGGATRFEGYTDADASERKILRDVFAAGDAWYRTGDLLRRDACGFFYFVDRVGDTFRWKGENVSTTEVAGALAGCPGVCDAAVYGVEVPGAEGRAGMVALVVGPGFSLEAFRRAAAAALPTYARPVFVRVVPAIELTGTFKLRKQELAREGYDPARVRDALYLDDPSRQAYVRLDAALHRRLMSAALRL